MIGIEIHQSDKGLGRVTSVIESRLARVVFDVSLLLLTQIRTNASTGFHKPGEGHIPGTGPGPNVATGDYRRSWNVQTGYDATGNPHALVSTQSPQAARLEYGFVEVDALGRSIPTPPYPHVRPAVDQYEPVLAQQVRAAVAAAVREVSA